MRKVLLLSAAAILGTTFAGATNLELQDSNGKIRQIVQKKQQGKVISSKKISTGISEQTLDLGSDLRMKQLNITPLHNNNTLNPNLKPARVSTPPTGYSLFEDFQSWDGKDTNWLPDGWSVDRKVKEDGHTGWYPYKPDPNYDLIPSTCMVFNEFNSAVDEWLVAPRVKVEKGMELSFLTYNNTLYYLDFDYVDMANGFVYTEKKIANDFRVNISTDGGKTWSVLKSLAQDAVDDPSDIYFELYYRMGLCNYNISLDDYAGQDVTIAFQVVGRKEGNAAFVDDVTIGLPPVKLKYSKPTGALWFGVSNNNEVLPASVLTVPVFAPLTFVNTSSNPGATYSWTYADSRGNEFGSDEQKNLSVTYTTNHTTELDSRNNWQTMPVLYGQAPGMAPGQFTYDNWLQAGGRGEYEKYIVDEDASEIVQLGLTVADPWQEGTTTWADIALPYFGYNQESDRFWTDYTFGGDNGPTDYTHLEKIGNFFYSTDAPLVIDGVRLNAFGRITDDAEFKAELYLLNKGYMIADKPYATAVCKGDDIKVVDQSAFKTNNDIYLNFKFDQPVVMSKDVAPYYIVFISGFRDEKNVDYFSPLMSEYSNPDNLGLGWCWVETSFYGDTQQGQLPVANVTNDILVSFYIMLDAQFPWLEGDVTEHTTSADAPTTLTLDSYHGESLTVEGLPLWLNARVSGRYDKTQIEFTSTNPDEATATVTVKAPGVSKAITIKNTKSTGVAHITVDANDGTEILYNMAGQPVNPRTAPKGIYILRRADGSTSKVNVR